jgi:uncharacterized membrane protein YdjX (TVP38/TMEM64 family)
MLGLSRVRFVPFLIGTIVGLLPGMLAATYAGGHGLDWLMRQEIEVIAGTVTFVLAAVGGIIWWRRRQRLPELASGERKLLGG